MSAAVLTPIGVAVGSDSLPAGASVVIPETVYAVSDVHPTGLNEVIPIDTSTNTAQSSYGFNNPFAVAIAPNGLTAYVVSSNDSAVYPIDLGNGDVGPPIQGGGLDQPTGIAITPDGQAAYVTDTDGAVTPIDLATRTAGPSITGAGLTSPWGIAITPDGKTAYVTDVGSGGGVTPIDLTTNTAGTRITWAGASAGELNLAITPDGSTAYVATEQNSVIPIDLSTNTAGAPITGGGLDVTWGIAISPDGQTAYVSNDGGNVVTPIDTATNTVETPISVGQGTAGIAITPNGRTLYVSGSSVIPIDLATQTAGTPITGTPGVSSLAIGPSTSAADPTVGSVTPSSGPASGGTSVTITGTNLTGADSVTIGGNPATITDGGANSITVTTPEGTLGPADVVVTAPGGTATDTGGFTYEGVTPTITGVSFQGTEASPTIVINGTGFGTEGALGPANPPGCSNLSPTGNDFGDNLWIQDWTANWLAGREQACVGLTVVSYSDTQIVLTPGSLYSSYGWFPGDSFTMVVLGSSFMGTVGYPGPGGGITLSKATALIGNDPEKVSGTGWQTNGDTTVTINQCATASYSAATCDAANQSTATIGTGLHLGTFSSAVIKLAVGTIDTNGDTCGLSGSVPCYIVVVGNTGDFTASAALGFTLPSFTVHKTTGVLGNSVDAVKATGIPIGDTVVAQECDGSVSVPATVSSNCDATTQISGTAGTSGAVVFTSTGVTIRVGGAYLDSASGPCPAGGTCDIGFTDSNNADIGTSVAVAFTAPTIKVTKTVGVLGNYVEKVTALGFPIGDTIDAVECDSSAITANLGQHCDDATQISGTVSAGVYPEAAGEVTGTAWSALGVTMRVDGAYSDSADGSCLTGGSCYVGAIDSTNPSVNALTGSLTMAIPTVTITPTTVANGNGKTITVSAKGFPVGDTVDAVECDTAFSGALSNCDTAKTQISGTAGATGTVVWSPTTTRIPVLTTVTLTPYADNSSPPATCAPGDSVANTDPCFVYTYDVSNSAISNTSPFGVS